MTTEHDEAEYEVVWPLSKTQIEHIEAVETLGVLDGKRVAYIWDYRFRGLEMWDLIVEDLVAQFPTIEFVGYEEFGNIHGDEETELVAAIPEKLRRLEVDGAVVGVAA